jgi:hypothetical protein
MITVFNLVIYNEILTISWDDQTQGIVGFDGNEAAKHGFFSYSCNVSTLAGIDTAETAEQFYGALLNLTELEPNGPILSVSCDRDITPSYEVREITLPQGAVI